MDENRESLFNGFQTLLQLLPFEIYYNKTTVDWSAPCVNVHDKPKFQWRGLMIDVCRYFFDVSTTKTIIDGMSHFKFNTLHFHLTEDQGWRLDLKKFPNLVKMRARDELDGIPYGPYSFSEDDAREIVEYARIRSIRVIPEIEIPGHALGLLCGYPQYSCNGGPFKPRCKWGVEADIICAGNDEAISFLESVLDEVMSIFPSVYIHCGGDECPRSRWQTCPKCQQRMKDNGLQNEVQLQAWFTRHFAVIMSWLGDVEKAAKLGHDVVITPNGYLYFTWQQFYAKEPFEYVVSYVISHTIYFYNPLKNIPENLTDKIIGVQGSIWSEYIWERTDLQWKTFPRALALAETAWLPNERKDCVRFMHDYSSHEAFVLANMGLFDAGLQYGTQGLWNKGELIADKWLSVTFPLDQSLDKNGNIKAAFIHKNGKNKTHVKNVKLLFNDAVVAEDDHEGVAADDYQNVIYSLKTSATVTSDNIKIQVEMMCEGGDDCEGIQFIFT